MTMSTRAMAFKHGSRCLALGRGSYPVAPGVSERASGLLPKTCLMAAPNSWRENSFFNTCMTPSVRAIATASSVPYPVRMMTWACSS